MDRSRPRGPRAPGRALRRLRRASAEPRGRVAATLRRLAAYCEKLYGLSRGLAAHLVDGRKNAQIPVIDVVRSVFVLFALRLPSLNALEEVQRRRGRPLVGSRAPSADTIGYAYARMDADGQRAVIAESVARMRRNKTLAPRGRLPWTVAIDGHELFKSFHRDCPACRRREVKTARGVRTQSYHQAVVAQVVACDAAAPCLDADLLGPDEGEAPAARRMLGRLIENHPWIEVFTMDALYLEEPILRPIVESGRGAVVPLKQENRDLFADAEALLAEAPLRVVTRGRERIEIREVFGLRSWDAMKGIPVRVVRTTIHRARRRRIFHRWVEQDEVLTWTWAVVGLGPEIDALVVHDLGHARWDIENRGFNEKDRFYAIDHCFKHEPRAIVNLLLTLFLAAALTELFLTRNVRRAELRLVGLSGRVRLLLEGLPLPGSSSIWASPRPP